MLYVNLVIGHERQPEAPAVEGAEHLGELVEGKVTAVDGDESLLRVVLIVAHELATQHVAARRPLVTILVVIDLWRTDGHLGQDVVLSGELIGGLNAGVETV